jgi:hypothetical protein
MINPFMCLVGVKVGLKESMRVFWAKAGSIDVSMSTMQHDMTRIGVGAGRFDMREFPSMMRSCVPHRPCVPTVVAQAFRLHGE